MSDKTTFVIARIDSDAMKGIGPLLKDRENVAAVTLRRTAIYGVIPTLASIITGVSLNRHQVHTATVPFDTSAEGEENAQDNSQPLQFRTSRMTGAPFIWNRLASRGIRTAVVNMPFRPAADDDLITEIPQAMVAHRAKKEGVSLHEANLGYILGAIKARPDTRCVITAASFLKQAATEAEDLDSERTMEQETVDQSEDESSEALEARDQEAEEGEVNSQAEAAGRKVLSFLQACAITSGADHVLAILLGQRMGTVVLISPRASEVAKHFVRIISCAPTILDLLGEPPAVDLQGASILPDASGGNSAQDTSWALEGGLHQVPDWSESIERVRAGKATDRERQVLLNHLSSSTKAGIFESTAGSVIESARTLQEIADTPAAGLRLAFILTLAGKTEEARERIRKLIEEHPDSRQADIARLITVWGLDSEGVLEILDRHPSVAELTFIERGIWGRASARVGREAEAKDVMWSLIMSGQATNQDRMTFATLALKTEEPMDAGRAALALRDIGNPRQATHNGQPRPEPVMLRAKALAKSGSVDFAKKLLGNYLEHHPQDHKVTALLRKLSEGQ